MGRGCCRIATVSVLGTIDRRALSEERRLAMERQTAHGSAPSPRVIKRAARRATKASAKLENRVVPAGHVRSAGVKRILAERQSRNR